MKPSMIMYVYNDITTDARVQRAADALADYFDLTLVSTQKGKQVEDKGYRNVLVGGCERGFRNIVSTIWDAWRMVRKQQPDVVYCHDYYSAILAYLLIKTRFSGKIVYDAHELIIPEDENLNKRLSFFYWFERRIVKRVNLLICASEQRGDIMQEHYGLPEKPLVIPNISQLQINDNNIETKKLLDSLEGFFAVNKPALVYAGAVTNSRRINELMDAAIALSANCKLLIVGNGDALNSLKKKAISYPELTCAFTGGIPYYCLGSVLSRCSLGFIYYPNTTINNRFCASNKVYEYASVGLPFVSNNNPTIKKEVDTFGIGIASDNFVLAIEEVLSDIGRFKKSCVLFNNKNQWAVFADLLRTRICQL